MDDAVLALKYALSSIENATKLDRHLYYDSIYEWNCTFNSKAEMYPAYLRGDFGNKLRTYDASLITDGEKFWDLPHYLTIRYLGGNASKYTRYNVPSRELDIKKWYKVIEELEALGANYLLFTFNESAPDDLLTIQGEVYRTDGYLYLRYSKAKLPMREALKQSAHAEGYTALAILQTYLDPPSMENLNHLLDTYADSIVEFSSFSQLVGTLGWNTVFWEVRNY